MSHSPNRPIFGETASRVIAGLVVVVAITFGWFSIRWQLGSMLSELTPPTDPSARSIAHAAQNLAPGDPLSTWLVASTEFDLFTPGHLESSLTAYEEVIRRSPNDYRWWIEMGRVYEQAGEADKAEPAFRQAVKLAPSYAFPHWQLGNFLLRQGRTDEAFAELRKTTENNLVYREQVFALAWDYFDHNPARVEALAADTPEVRVSLALFYAARSQAPDSLRVWNTLTDEQKAENPQTAKTIAQALTEKKYFRQGLEFSRQVGIDPDAQIGAITNGGFEKPFGSPDDNYYGWNVERSDNKLDISGDSSVKHGGNRSLKINFRTYIKSELSNPWQIVAVEPGASYTLHFWARTENLRSAGMPTIEIVDASDNRLLASAPPFASGTNDWREFAVDLKVPDGTEGFVVRLARSFCGEACPIVGLLWLDDFELVKK